MLIKHPVYAVWSAPAFIYTQIFGLAFRYTWLPREAYGMGPPGGYLSDGRKKYMGKSSF